MEEKINSFLNQVPADISYTGISTALIFGLTISCALLGMIIVRKFANIWQFQRIKQHFFEEVISRYETDQRTRDDISERSDIGG